MKLLNATVHGFGRLYRRSFSFQDGIHVIYGPNEAGKSTLHTFLGSMLFGIERGRGKAARNDLYSRFLPWEHDASYGGSLSFESDDQIFLLERNFRSDNRTCILTSARGERTECRDNALPESLYEGLTENLYYNTISIRQLQSAPDATLASSLTRQLACVSQSGSSTIDYASASDWLKAERKKLEARLTPGLEQTLSDRRDEAVRLEHKLRDVSFRQEKQDLETALNACMEQLEHAKGESSVSQTDSGEIRRPHRSNRRTGPKLFLLVFLLLAMLLLWQGYTAAAAVCLLLSFLPAACILLTGHRRGNNPQDFGVFRDEEDSLEDESNPTEEGDDEQASDHASEIHTTRLLLQQIRSLQKRYRDVLTREWEYEKLLEQSAALTEECHALQAQLERESELRLEIQSLSLALSALQSASKKLQNTLGPALNASLSQILQGLTDGAYSEIYVDSQLKLSLRTKGRTVPLEVLSRGTIELVYLALRLAVIDLVFPQGGMPLLLDDCFLSYDDARLAQTLTWLAENYSGQIFLFTCQKREAALLTEERIPFTLINL